MATPPFNLRHSQTSLIHFLAPKSFLMFKPNPANRLSSSSFSLYPDPILREILLASVSKHISQIQRQPLWSNLPPGFTAVVPNLSPQEPELSFYNTFQGMSLFCSKPYRGFPSHTEWKSPRQSLQVKIFPGYSPTSPSSHLPVTHSATALLASLSSWAHQLHSHRDFAHPTATCISFKSLLKCLILSEADATNHVCNCSHLSGCPDPLNPLYFFFFPQHFPTDKILKNFLINCIYFLVYIFSN